MEGQCRGLEGGEGGDVSDRGLSRDMRYRLVWLFSVFRYWVIGLFCCVPGIGLFAASGIRLSRLSFVLSVLLYFLCSLLHSLHALFIIIPFAPSSPSTSPKKKSKKNIEREHITTAVAAYDCHCDCGAVYTVLTLQNTAERTVYVCCKRAALSSWSSWSIGHMDCKSTTTAVHIYALLSTSSLCHTSTPLEPLHSLLFRLCI